jgi:hypothetical protein
MGRVARWEDVQVPLRTVTLSFLMLEIFVIVADFWTFFIIAGAAPRRKSDRYFSYRFGSSG